MTSRSKLGIKHKLAGIASVATLVLGAFVGSAATPEECTNACLVQYTNSIDGCAFTKALAYAVAANKFATALTICTNNYNGAMATCGVTFTNAMRACESGLAQQNDQCTNTYTAALALSQNAFNTAVLVCGVHNPDTNSVGYLECVALAEIAKTASDNSALIAVNTCVENAAGQYTRCTTDANGNNGACQTNAENAEALCIDNANAAMQQDQGAADIAYTACMAAADTALQKCLNGCASA